MVADTGNDRVFELDYNGNVIWGILSNTVSSSADLAPLTSSYNSNNSELAISFNKSVNVDSIDLTGIYLLKGSNLIQLNPGTEQLSQEDLNFVTITLNASHANTIDDSTGDMTITVAKDAVQDTSGNSLALSYNLDVFEGNVYWRRINKPIHAYKSENQYVVSHVSGSVYLESVVEFDSSATTKWSFSEPSFAIDSLGSTEKNSDGDYIIADSANQRVIKVDGDNSVITFTRTFDYYPARATELDSGNILVTISDIEGGSGSRVVEIDNNGNVVFSFGFGLLKDPTNAVKLSNGNYVITM
jgi:hypothetical protein